MVKILVTGAWKNAKNYTSTIEDLGCSVVFMQYEKEDLPCNPKDIDVVIANGLFLSHDIGQFENLKHIQLTSAGLDRVPMQYITKKGITLTNARGVYSAPMAEYVMFGVLSLYKDAKVFFERQKQHSWNNDRDLIELMGKTVCIVGCGSVGTECAKRFKAFGCTVNGVDVIVRQDDYYDMMYHLSELKVALNSADIVILTLPLTDETRGMMNEECFAQMKEKSVFVNISRGGVVDENALLKALDNRLLGAVLDVFEKEPLSVDSQLWDRHNVILTPHNSFRSDNVQARLDSLILQNIKKVIKDLS